ncbi:hypothetical protein PS6_005149 [Mucor atramentarius]
MNLPQEYQEYKLKDTGTGSNSFFSSFPAREWNFVNYFKSTHGNLNKFKKYNVVKKSFKDDLDWILNMDDVPSAILQLVGDLIKQDLPTKSKMKSDTSKEAVKNKEIFQYQPIIINGDAVHNTVVNSSNVRVDNSKTGTSRKRKHRDEGDVVRAQQTREEDSTDDGDNTDGEKDESDASNESDVENGSIWKDWLKFLDEKEKDFHPFSPVSHRIVRCGKGISPRPYLNRALYNRHLATFQSENHALPSDCVVYMNSVIDSEDLAYFKAAMKSIPSDCVESEIAVEFLEDIFRAAYRGYSTFQDVNDGESTFDDLFIYPYLVAVSKAVQPHSCKADFKVGETCLQSMSRQLKALGLETNDKNQYKADGLIKLYGFKKLEVLLLETSGSHENNDKVKINFDHHKAIFGVLAMLKTIADEFRFASVKTFQHLKLYFVHAAGE